MSYSFSLQATSKAEVAVLVLAELDKVAAAQPCHDADRQAAQDAVEQLTGLLRDPADGERVSVSVAGSLGWQTEGEYTSAQVSVSVCISPA